MSKFMNGLNNDIPSPVEEGVVDWFKKKIGKSDDSQKVSSEEIRVFKNVASVIDIKLLNETLKKFDAVIKKVLNRPEYSQLKRGFYKVNPNDWWIGKSRYEELSTGIGFFKNNLLPNQKYWIGVYGIRYDKIFKGKEYLDLSPEAERGDTSEYGKAFWDLAKKFENDVLDTDFGKIPGFNGIDFDSINDWDDDPEVQIAIIIDPSKLVAKESYTFPSDKEAVQEELFPILTGKELPVREGTWFDVAAIFGMLGIYAAGTYVKNRFFTKHAKGEKPSVTAEDFKKWLEEHPVDEAERRKVMKEVFPLFKKHFPKDCENGVINNMSGEWYDDKKFITGESNIWDFCFILSTIQGLPYPDTDDIDVESYEYSKLEKKYHSDLRKCKQAVNDELKKKYNGRYEIRLEELDEIDDGDGDEGCCVLVDVKRTKQLAEFYKSKEATKESFTEITTESDDTPDLSFWDKVKVIGFFGAAAAIIYKSHKLSKEDAERRKKEDEERVKKEIEEINKREHWIENHPIDPKERLAIYNFALTLVRGEDNYLVYTSDEDKPDDYEDYQLHDKDSFIGKRGKRALIPDYFIIDLCSEIQDHTESEEREILKSLNAKLHKKFGKRYALRYGYKDRLYLVDVTIERSFIATFKKKEAAKESTTYDPFLDDANIVTEGWGIAFTRFAVKHNLPFANKLEDKIWEWSESTVNQLTNIPEFKEYILREAPKAYDEAYLRNNNLSINVNADMISEFEEEYEDSETYHKVDKKNCCFCKKIGKFYVGVFGDKSHIHGVWLLMSDSKNKKIYAKALPAPEKELNKFKYQK